LAVVILQMVAVMYIKWSHVYYPCELNAALH